MFMIYYYCLGFSIVKISIIVIFRGNNHEHPSSSSRVPYLGYHLPRHQSQVCHARRACTATPGGQVDLRPTPEHDWREMYPLVKKHSYGKSPFLMGKSAISMAIFNSKLLMFTRGYGRFHQGKDGICRKKRCKLMQHGDVRWCLKWGYDEEFLRYGSASCRFFVCCSLKRQREGMRAFWFGVPHAKETSRHIKICWLNPHFSVSRRTYLRTYRRIHA